MVDYEGIEKAVVARLASLEPVAVIYALPEDQANKKPPLQKPTIMVGYHSSVYKGVTLSDGMAQDERVFVQVEVSGKKRFGAGGVMAIMQGCKSLLLGYYLDYPVFNNSNEEIGRKKYGNALAFKEAGWVSPDNQDSIWTYILVAYLDTMAIQADIEETTQLIEQITVEASLFNTETVDTSFDLPEA